MDPRIRRGLIGWLAVTAVLTGAAIGANGLAAGLRYAAIPCLIGGAIAMTAINATRTHHHDQ